MLRFITGKTGGGKTQFAVGRFIDALRETDLPIVTNMAIRLDPWVNGRGVPYKGLLATLEQRFGDTYNARRRIVFIGPDQVQRFYALRPKLDPDGETVLQEVPRCEDGLFHKDGGQFGGCHYFIDEAHEYFPQQEWTKIGKETMSWASQNRRAGDEAWLLTQEAELVAKPFRRQSLECYWMVNHAYKTFGPWRQMDTITYRVYATTPPRDSEPCLRLGRMGYPREMLWHCYDTASGAGVSGGGADIGKRAKGLPIWTIPAAIAGIMVAALLGFKGCQAAVARAVTLKGPVTSSGVTSNAVTAVPARTNAVQLRELVRGPGVSVPRVRQSDTGVGVRTWTEGRAGFAVVFSDGLVISAKSVQAMGREVLVDGVVYPLVVGKAPGR